MANTSATGGFLTLTSEITRQDRERIIHDIICALCGLPNELVRPRWQPIPAQQPPHDINWCAFGFMEGQTEVNPAFIFPTDNNGNTKLIEYETADLLCTFYGKDAYELAGQLRASLLFQQNRDTLYNNGMSIKQIGKRSRSADLVNSKFIQTVELHIYINIELIRQAQVYNYLGSNGEIIKNQEVRRKWQV